MKAYRLVILDLDGTLYRGNEALPGAREVVGELQRRGMEVRFLTNNSGQTRDFYVQKLSRMGFLVKHEDLYSSAIGAARLCSDEGLERIFYVGEPGLAETLELSGLQVMNRAEPLGATGRAQAVVAGICRSYTYRWMDAAMQQILSGAMFIATNADATYPVEDGRVEPGAGAVVASIETATGTAPRVIGKPNPYLVQLILQEAGVAPGDALCVGDRYDTDILGGMNAGVDTHLVLTGVTTTPPPGVSWSKTLKGLL